MRRIIMWNLVALDGFFEGPKSWDLDFHKLVWGEELEQISIQQLRSADTLLFGRVTYEGMAAYWSRERGLIADLMNSIAKIVFSRTLEKAEWNNTTLVRDHAEEEVAKLKRQAGKDVYIFGSAALSSTLTSRRLIDEYRLALVPVLLGRGNLLFNESPRTTVKLLEARQLKNGCVILRYEPSSDNIQESLRNRYEMES
jgi:dihydrofolate reductase